MQIWWKQTVSNLLISTSYCFEQLYHITTPVKNYKTWPLECKWLLPSAFCFYFRYRRLYKKNARRYMLYTLKVSKTYGYIPELQARILQKRLVGKGMPRRRTLQPDDPRRYGPLPPVPAPTFEDLLHTQVRRGLGRLNFKFFFFFCTFCYMPHNKSDVKHNSSKFEKLTSVFILFSSVSAFRTEDPWSPVSITSQPWPCSLPCNLFYHMLLINNFRLKSRNSTEQLSLVTYLYSLTFIIIPFLLMFLYIVKSIALLFWINNFYWKKEEGSLQTNIKKYKIRKQM